MLLHVSTYSQIQYLVESAFLMSSQIYTNSLFTLKKKHYLNLVSHKNPVKNLKIIRQPQTILHKFSRLHAQPHHLTWREWTLFEIVMTNILHNKYFLCSSHSAYNAKCKFRPGTIVSVLSYLQYIHLFSNTAPRLVITHALKFFISKKTWPTCMTMDHDFFAVIIFTSAYSTRVLYYFVFEASG